MSEKNIASEVSPKLPKKEIERNCRELRLDLVSRLVESPEFQEVLREKFLPPEPSQTPKPRDGSLYDYKFTKDGEVYLFSAGTSPSGMDREFRSFYVQVGDWEEGDLFWLGEPFHKNYYNTQSFRIGTRVGGDTQIDNQPAIDRFRTLIARFASRPKA